MSVTCGNLYGFNVFVKKYKGEPRVYIRRIYEDPLKGRSVSVKSLSPEEWIELKNATKTIDEELIMFSRSKIPDDLVKLGVPFRMKCNQTGLPPPIQNRVESFQQAPLTAVIQQASPTTETAQNTDVHNIPSLSTDAEKQAASAELFELLKGYECCVQNEHNPGTVWGAPYY